MDTEAALSAGVNTLRLEILTRRVIVFTMIEKGSQIA
jgi:hypothetical protein